MPPAIVRANLMIRYPLLKFQEQIYLRQALSPNGSSDNVAYLTEIRGLVDSDAFFRSLRQVGEEIDLFRLQIVNDSNGNGQFIGSEPNWCTAFVDCSVGRDTMNCMDEWIASDKKRSVGMEGPLFSHCLFRVRKDLFFWYSRSHHIALDHFSGMLLARRIAAVYSALVEQITPPELFLRSFICLLEEDREYRRSERFSSDRRFWMEELADCPAAVSLSQGRVSSGDDVWWIKEILPAYLLDPLKKRMRPLSVSLPQILTGVVAAYIYRMSGERPFALGFPVSGRIGPAARAAVGPKVNMLPLSFEINSSMKMEEVISTAALTVRRCMRHQSYRVEDVAAELGKGALLEKALFNILLNYIPPIDGIRFGQAEGFCRILSYGQVDDLSLTFCGVGNGEVEMNVLGNAERYTDVQLRAHAGAFLEFLRRVSKDPRQPVSRVRMLGDSYRRQTIEKWNNTGTQPTRAGLVDLFEQQVERSKNLSAVVFKETALSYNELNARANQLAHYLIEMRIGREDRVAIALPKSMEMVIAILAVAKAGAAYVPLDPEYPDQRLDEILEDCRPCVVLTNHRIGKQLCKEILQVCVCDETFNHILSKRPVNNPSDTLGRCSVLPQSPAYIIYTSGSSGRPKGVVMPIVGLCNLLTWHLSSFGCEVGAVAQFAAIGFDLSAHEIFSTLLAGKTLYVPSDEARRDPRMFRRWLEKNNINELFGSDTVLRAMLGANEISSSDLVGLRRVFQAGEPLSPELLDMSEASAGPETRLGNYYGPTECQAVTYYSVSERDQGKAVIPIGNPVWNTEVYVLDHCLAPVPIGLDGEIYIGGIQLARGYWNRPGLTAERFVANPFVQGGGRMYRSGDIARSREDGTLVHLGRADDQIKIRGLRIEPGEIQTVLTKHPKVRSAAVVMREDQRREKQLFAYIVPVFDEGFDEAELRTYLSERLPAWMIPAAFVSVADFPVTANGKLDRGALPSPRWDLEYTPPQNTTEQVLVDLFSNLLSLDRVGRKDNFFQRGGHSLLATQLASEVRRRFGIDMPLEAIFDTPTVAKLAERIEELQLSEHTSKLALFRPGKRPAEIPLSFAQERLWFIEQMGAPLGLYNLPVAVRLSGELHVEAFSRALREIVQRHESLRTRFENHRGKGVQLVEAIVEVKLEIEERAILDEAKLQIRLKEEAQLGFDLGRPPLMRAKLFRINATDHIGLMTMHHIVSDGWSMGIFVDEFSRLYNAYTKSSHHNLPSVELQYADYALWQREWLKGEVLDGLRDYWVNRLIDAPTSIELPTDHQRPEVQSFEGAEFPVELSRELSGQIRELAQLAEVTPFMVLLAGYQVLLGRWSNQNDVVIGTPIANRVSKEVEGMIGFFANTLVLRTVLNLQESFGTMLDRVRKETLEAYAHQDYPFEKLVEVLRPGRELGRQPIVQAMFVLQNAPLAGLRLHGLEVCEVKVPMNSAKFDLTLSLEEREGSFRGFFQYATELFEAPTIGNLSLRLERVLGGLVNAPDRAIGEADMLSPEERTRVLGEWNEAASAVELRTAMAQLFPNLDR
jgi:nonribosomal peptide synthetase DhbF